MQSAPANVAPLVSGGRKAGVRLRRAEPEDAIRLLQWRNHPAIARWSFSGGEISLETHQVWLAKQLADADVRLWIVEEVGVPVGQVRLTRSSSEVEVHVAIAPEAQGRRLGTAAIRLASDWARTAWPGCSLIARIMPHNEASRRSFEKAGYVRLRGEEGAAWTFGYSP